MALNFGASTMKWSSPEGQNILKIMNESDKRFAIKVKTSNVEAYATTPVTDFIAPKFSLNMVVIRRKAPLKDDKLSISYVEVDEAETDAAAVFKKPGVTPNVFMITMKCGAE